MVVILRRLSALSVLLCLLLPPGAGAAPTTLETKRKDAARLDAQMAAAGKRLSLAAEDYNDARLERVDLDIEVAASRKELEAAERRWEGLRDRLGRRVRFMYMHPGVWAMPVLGASSWRAL